MSEDNHTVVRVDALPACDFCKEERLVKEGRMLPYAARYDGKTVMGPWAYMCGAHFSKYGMGLGLGVGQYLKLRDEP